MPTIVSVGHSDAFALEVTYVLTKFHIGSCFLPSLEGFTNCTANTFHSKLANKLYFEDLNEEAALSDDIKGS
jgi:hypothetical protein